MFIRKKRPEANSIEEIFYLLIKKMGPDVELVELPYGGANITSIVKNIIFARKHRGDVNHISGEVHYIALGTGRNTLITIHDVQSIIRGGWLERIIKKWLWFKLPVFIACRISVISQFTKDELLRVCPFARNKISIIYNPIRDNFNSYFYEENAKKQVYKILHIGTKVNKNLEGVLNAIKNLPVKLIVVGAMTTTQIKLASSLNIDYDNFYNLSYEQILNLYSQADLVTFPSFYEGFGMPIVEANMMAVPILVSDIPVLHEIAGDAAYFVSPNSIEDIRKGICKLLCDEKLRNDLIQRGRENIKRFSVDSIVEQYKQIYRKILKYENNSFRNT